MVRQAVFNILMSRIPDARVLDLYAGSGAIGLEALSRGAAEATWVERDRKTLAILRANAELIDSHTSRIVADDAIRFLRRATDRPPYDIIYADPPYTDARAGEQDPLTDLLELIRTGQVLANDGIFVYESAGGRRASKEEPPEGWQTITDREYGRTRIRAFALADND
jgi:16S rRNA (guanine966-N2)-methyltransferase